MNKKNEKIPETEPKHYNFTHLDKLIHSKEKEITLDADVKNN